MSVAPIDAWTVDDLDDLDLPPGSKVEIIDGSLHVTPAPAVGHQAVSRRLRHAIERQLPDSLVLLTDLGVGDQRRYLVPDLVVADADAVAAASRAGSAYLAPDAVLLAVEVVSPSSRTHDWVTKPNAYPSLGVPLFWVVDPIRREAALGADGTFTLVTDVLAVDVGTHTLTADLAEVLG